MFLLSCALFQEESTLQRLEKEIAAVVEKVRPSVVRVESNDLIFSGIVYTKEGHVLTDASGVEHTGEIRVLVGDRAYPAERVDSDRRTGVAVLKISAKELAPSAAPSSSAAGSTRTCCRWTRTCTPATAAPLCRIRPAAAWASSIRPAPPRAGSGKRRPRPSPSPRPG